VRFGLFSFCFYTLDLELKILLALGGFLGCCPTLFRALLRLAQISIILKIGFNPGEVSPRIV
jgi:hypothetical protein